MGAYVYKARDATGKPVKGVREAANRQALVDQLRQMGYLPTSVTEALPDFSPESFFENRRRVSVRDMVLFNVQLSDMIHAGLSAMGSLNILGRQSENKRLRDIIGEVARDVQGGETLSTAFSRHPAAFSRFFVNMVKAGEASGKLDIVLKQYADYYERQADLRQKIQGALFYPAILLAAGLAVMLFIVTNLIPQFAEIFTRAGVRLPLLTLVLYKTGLTIRQFWVVAALLAAGICLAVRWYVRTESGRLWMDSLKLNMFFVGPLFYRKVLVSRFAMTLGTLLGSGVPILESLDITRDVVDNQVLVRAINAARNSVEKGQSLSEPLEISREFPLDVVGMISVGEETGDLAGMLGKISDLYDKALGYSIKKMTTVIEPVLLLVMGGVVGVIMASILLPIFDMIKVLRR